MSDYETAVDIILGRWKSQILYVAVKLGIFDSLGMGSRSASEIAKELELDPSMSYRLMRALASLGFLSEDEDQKFAITPMGQLMRGDHPQTLRGVILLEEGPEHYAIWKHLPSMVKDGIQDGFQREFGQRIFDYLAKTPEYAQVFNNAMNSYSASHTKWILDALKGYDFGSIRRMCDIAGGHGHLMCHILKEHPHLNGTVLELEVTVRNRELLWAEKMGLTDRCEYVAGDMFRNVPTADAYIMKMILHDWNDDECVRILSNVRDAAPPGGRVLIAEHVVPGPGTPHFAKLFDIHMMCALTGRERTELEYTSLLQRAGLKYVRTHYPTSGAIGVVEGVKS